LIVSTIGYPEVRAVEENVHWVIKPGAGDSGPAEGGHHDRGEVGCPQEHAVKGYCCGTIAKVIRE
jgi:hypothetical protein